MSLEDYSWPWLFQGSTYLVPSSPLKAIECDVTRQRCGLLFLAQAHITSSVYLMSALRPGNEVGLATYFKFHFESVQF